MMKLFLFLILFSVTLFAYVDGDMDGVEDKNDLCLSTPFTDLVGLDGCSIESLVSPHHFSVVAGISLSDSNYNELSKTETLTTSLQLDYYYKNFSLSLVTSHYKNMSKEYSASGMNDTYLGAAYQWAYKDLYMSFGVGVLLPTYDTGFNNNNTDYTGNINLSYTLKNINIFAVYGHTIINDEDIEDVALYQDSTKYSTLGLGYFFGKDLYVSAYYNESDSVYEDIEKLKTLSLYSYYSLDENYFITANYAYGISDSASNNYITLKVGYYY